MVPAPIGRGAAPIYREPASGGDLRSLVGGVTLPLRANDATWPIAGPTVCRRRGSGRLPRWIRRASNEPRQQTGAPPIYLRRAAHSLVGVACSSAPSGDQFFTCNRHLPTANDFLASY